MILLDQKQGSFVVSWSTWFLASEVERQATLRPRLVVGRLDPFVVSALLIKGISDCHHAYHPKIHKFQT